MSSVFDRQQMVRAVALARKCRSEPGRVAPRVAAIVVRGGRRLAEAFRGELGVGEHAEFTLLERKLPHRTLAGATLFTTLEPCTSRNAPKRACVDRIIERRIKRVIIGTLDPNKTVRGEGELRLRAAGIEVGRFDPDLMGQLEELNREFIRLHPLSTGRRKLTIGESGVGPNGYPLGRTPRGDLVEWIPDDERPGKTWPLILRRNDRAIRKAYNEFWDKVWYNRHMIWADNVRAGKDRLHASGRKLFANAERAARRIEKKYGGPAKLRWDDFEWGLLTGRMSALAWVLGSEWEGSSDT